MADPIKIESIPGLFADSAKIVDGVPPDVIWEVLRSGRDLDSVLDTYESEMEELGVEIPSWLDDWDMSDTTKVREAVNIMRGVEEPDEFGVGGPSLDDVVDVVDQYPELMDIADLVEQGLIDMGADTDDFDDFMEDVYSTVGNLDDDKVNSILESMDAARDTDNPEAALYNVSSLLSGAEEEMEREIDPLTLIPPYIRYGGYDTSTAYGAMVRVAVDSGMSLEDAEEYASGRRLPGEGGPGVTGREDWLPPELQLSDEDLEDYYYEFGQPDELEMQKYGFGKQPSITGRPGFEGEDYFTEESLFGVEGLEGIKVWKKYFEELPNEHYEYIRALDPLQRKAGTISIEEYLRKDLRELFIVEEGPGYSPQATQDRNDNMAHLFNWLYTSLHDGSLKDVEEYTNIGDIYEVLAESVWLESTSARTNLTSNSYLEYASDLFHVSTGGDIAFPEKEDIRSHGILRPYAEGQSYFEDLIGAGRSEKDIFDRAFEKKYPGLTSEWYDDKRYGLFKDAGMHRYFEKLDEDEDRYQGFGAARVETPFHRDEEYYEKWLENPAEHQTALFGNVAELGEFLHVNSWGTFDGEDYERFKGRVTDFSFIEKGQEETGFGEEEIDEQLAGRLGLNISSGDENSSHREQFALWKTFNPLLYKAGGARYNAAVLAIKQAAISSLTPVGASAESRSAMTKQINRDYDDFTSIQGESPLSFLRYMLSGGRTVSSQSLAPVGGPGTEGQYSPGINPMRRYSQPKEFVSAEDEELYGLSELEDVFKPTMRF